MRLLPILFFLLSGSLNGQIYAQFGGGFSGLFGQTGASDASVQGELGYRLALNDQYCLRIGLGLSRSSYSSTSTSRVLDRIGDFPMPYTQVYTHLLRPDQLQLRLGAERRVGSLIIQASVLPNYVVSSQLKADRTFYSRGGEQLGDIDFTEVPHQRQRPQGYVGIYHRFMANWSLNGSLGAALPIGENWRIGLEYQGAILADEVVISSEFDCPEDQFCVLIGTFTREISERKGAIIFQASYTW